VIDKDQIGSSYHIPGVCGDPQGIGIEMIENGTRRSAGVDDNRARCYRNGRFACRVGASDPQTIELSSNFPRFRAASEQAEVAATGAEARRGGKCSTYESAVPAFSAPNRRFAVTDRVRIYMEDIVYNHSSRSEEQRRMLSGD
jgi:hypothetical protein